MAIQNKAVEFKYYSRENFNNLVSKDSSTFYVVKETDGSLSFYLGDEPLSRDSLYLKAEDLSGAATTITSSDLTKNRALISNGDGKVAVSAVTSTELGFLDGVTSGIQAQLNGKAAASHSHNYDDIKTGDMSFNGVYFKRYLGKGNSTPRYADIPTADRHKHRFWRISFPTGVNFWGKIKITLYGAYSSFNASGSMAKEINVNFNGSTMYSNVGSYTELSGYVEKDFRISEAIWNDDTSQWEFLVYSDRLSGNNSPAILIEGWASSTSYENAFNGITFTLTPELREDTTYDNVRGNAAGQTLTKNWSDLPTFQSPYGFDVLTDDMISDWAKKSSLAIGDIPTGTTGSTVALGNHTHSQYTTKTYVDNEISTISLTPGPKGDDGADGKDGKDGADGLPGQAATVSVGTTTTGAAGTDALVTQTGSAQDRVFNFTIPRGVDGKDGTNGTNGVDGKGWTGVTYSSSTGKLTFASSDGLGYTTGDIRGKDGSDASLTKANIKAVGAVLTTDNQSIAGTKTFTGTVIVPAPSANTHAATKKYVDDKAVSLTGVIKEYNWDSKDQILTIEVL